MVYFGLCSFRPGGFDGCVVAFWADCVLGLVWGALFAGWCVGDWLGVCLFMVVSAFVGFGFDYAYYCDYGCFCVNWFSGDWFGF